MHAGHVSYLAQARQAGDLLVIGVNDDASVKRQKGPERPVNSLVDRLTVLASLAAVDYLLPFSDDTPLKLLESFRPDVLAKGADWEIEKIPYELFVGNQSSDNHFQKAIFVVN